jgi:signal transduction histidine kinase
VDGRRGVAGPLEDREERPGVARIDDDAVERAELQREFVAMVLHDLRGPATSVAGLAEVLLERWREFDEDRIDRMLRRTVSAADRITRLTEDVLAAAEVEAAGFTYRIEVFDLLPVVRDATEQVASSAGRNIEVEVDGALPLVRADEDRQRQVLGNLLSNAVKFSPPSGRITVGLVAHDDVVAVRVHDEGASLTEDDVVEVFRPFARLERRGTIGGTGLGLAIVRTLVEGQGGVIWVDPPNVAGEGTRFVYTVPAAGGGRNVDGTRG